MNRMDWMPEQDDPVVRDKAQIGSTNSMSPLFRDDRKWYAQQRKEERALDRIERQYLNGEITDEEYLKAVDYYIDL